MSGVTWRRTPHASPNAGRVREVVGFDSGDREVVASCTLDMKAVLNTHDDDKTTAELIERQLVDAFPTWCANWPLSAVTVTLADTATRPLLRAWQEAAHVRAVPRGRAVGHP